MQKIILYTQIVNRVSGVQTFEKNFCEAFIDQFDITYVYKNFEAYALDRFPKELKKEQDIGQQFDCDICIYSSYRLGVPAPAIRAKKYIQIYHTDIFKWEIPFDPNRRIDLHVAVGPSVARSLKEHYNVDAVVIPNILDESEPEKALRFVTFSRIYEGKGFDRIVKMAKMLKQDGRKFTWEIFGEGSRQYIEQLKYDLSGIQEVVFMGPREEAKPYLRGADFLVQLSDNEGFCYSIYEALQLQIPCIVTDFEGARELIDKWRGFVVDMDMLNLPIKEIYEDPNKQIPSFHFRFLPPSDKGKKLWKEVLSI